MKVLNLVQRFGVGIQMARRELAESGNPPPEFTFDSHSVICRVYPANSAEPQMADKITQYTTGSITAQAHDEAHVEAYYISETELLTLRACRHTPQSTAELLKILGYKTRTGNFKKALMRLENSFCFLQKTLPVTPRSKKQKYQLTLKGQAFWVNLQRGRL